MNSYKNNRFKLNCDPSTVNLTEILASACASTDYQNWGFAIFSVSKNKFKPVPVRSVRRYLSCHRNNQHPDFLSVCYKTSPIKVAPTASQLKAFEEKFGSASLNQFKTLISEKCYPLSTYNKLTSTSPSYPVHPPDELIEELKTIHCLEEDVEVAETIQDAEEQGIQEPNTGAGRKGRVTSKTATAYTSIQTPPSDSDRDRNAVLLNYATRGEELLKKLESIPNVLSDEEFAEQYPQCGDPTKKFLKVLDIMQREPYYDHYQHTRHGVKVVYPDNSTSNCLDVGSLGLPTQQLFTLHSEPHVEDFNGISSAMTFIGYPLSIFPVHVEELFAQNSLNFLICGLPKVWVIIPERELPKFRQRLEEYVKLMNLKLDVKKLLAHKQLFVHPALLTLLGIEFSIVEQHEGDIIVTGPGSYHQGFNSGLNVAVAINIVLERWVQRMASMSLGKDEKYLGLLCGCKESCLGFVDTGECMKANFKFLLNDDAVFQKSLTSHIRAFVEKYTRLTKPELVPCKMNHDLFCWLSDLYVNFSLSKWMGSRPPRCNGSRSNAAPENAILTLADGSALDLPTLKYLVIEGETFALYDTPKQLEINWNNEQNYWNFERIPSPVTHAKKSGEGPPFICTGCEALQKSTVFDSQQKLDIHLRRSRLVFACREPDCDTQLYRRDRMLEHYQLKHRPNKIFCPNCFSWFTVRAVFLAHLKNCNGWTGAERAEPEHIPEDEAESIRRKRRQTSSGRSNTDESESSQSLDSPPSHSLVLVNPPENLSESSANLEPPQTPANTHFEKFVIEQFTQLSKKVDSLTKENSSLKRTVNSQKKLLLNMQNQLNKLSSK